MHSEYQWKLGREKSTPRDALAPYPWSRSVNWCLAEAEEMEISTTLWLGKDFAFAFYGMRDDPV